MGAFVCRVWAAELCIGVPLTFDLDGTFCGDEVAIMDCGDSGLGGNESVGDRTGFISLGLLCEGDV